MQMSMQPSLKLQQKLSPQMIQSLSMLQMNVLQLEQILHLELQENPLLEMSEEQDGDQEEYAEQEDTDTDEGELEVDEDAVDWQEYMEEGYSIRERDDLSQPDRNEENGYQRQSVYATTLYEHLETQLSERKIDEQQHALAQFLIASIEPDGYLKTPLEEIASYLKVPVPQVEEALYVIQQFDPPGIGARDLRECLLLQLGAKNIAKDSLVMRIVRDNWSTFQKFKIPDLAASLQVTTNEIYEALRIIKSLHPKPGFTISDGETANVIPDLIVTRMDGRFIPILNDPSVPNLYINHAYLKTMQQTTSAQPSFKKYIHDKFQRARWILRAIEQRKSTMIRVMNAIIDAQQTFFEQGPPHLNPLRMEDIARTVGMHTSTISRVANNKYVQTEHGIFELRYFFTEAMNARNGEAGTVSTERIRSRIKELIDNEDPQKPLSDQKIADILKKEGLTTARRTVAKYREQLKILPARIRQNYETN
jgi:RNA polymerase sigma-54 factor